LARFFRGKCRARADQIAIRKNIFATFSSTWGRWLCKIFIFRIAAHFGPCVIYRKRATVSPVTRSPPGKEMRLIVQHKNNRKPFTMLLAILVALVKFLK
jgi:hypothetical protein